MNKLILLSILFFLLSYTLSAQVVFGTSDVKIGYFPDINSCNYIILGDYRDITRDERGVIKGGFGDITLSPNGELYAILGSSTLTKIDIKNNKVIEIGDFSRRSLTSLNCSKEGIIFGMYKTVEFYDLNTQKFSGDYASLSPYSVAGGAFIQDNHIIYSTLNQEIIKFDLDNINFDFNNVNRTQELIFQDSSTNIILGGLTTFGDRIIGSTVNFSEELDNEFGLYEVDLDKKEIQQICQENEVAFWGLSSETEFRTNYQMYLDLDKDNNSGRFINHFQSDTFCLYQLPIADQDATLETELAVDSIVVTIETAQRLAGERLILLDAPTTITSSGTGDSRLVLSGTGQTSAEDYLAAIQQLRYDITEVIPFKDERVVHLQMYSGTQKSDIAKAFLNIDRTRIPYAGSDLDTVMCQHDSLFNVLDLLGNSVDDYGIWEPEIRWASEIFSPRQNAAGQYQYIVQTGDCPADTAKLALRYFELASPEEAIQPFYQIEPGDTLEIDISISNGVDYFWQEEEATSTEIAITGQGVYEGRVVDENTCEQVFDFVVLEEAVAPADSFIFHRVEGRVYHYKGNTEIEGATLHFSSTEKNLTFEQEVAAKFEADVLAGTYEVSMRKGGNPLERVSTFDILLIQQHILGIRPFERIDQHLAADANFSGTITTADMLFLKKLILSQEQEFANNQSYVFVKEDYHAINQDPFEALRNNSYEIRTSQDEREWLHFLGIKVGDVSRAIENVDIIGESTSTSRNRQQAQLLGADRWLAKGAIYTLYLEPSTPLTGYQFMLQSNDLSLLSFEGQPLEEAKLTNEDGFTWVATNDQELKVIWLQSDAATTGAATTGAFSLEVRANKAGYVKDLIHLATTDFKNEGYTNGMEQLNLALSFSDQDHSQSVASSSDILFKIQPNPVRGNQVQLLLEHLPSTELTISLYGVTGELLSSYPKQQVEGTYQQSIDLPMLPGVYWIQVQTATGMMESLKVVVFR